MFDIVGCGERDGGQRHRLTVRVLAARDGVGALQPLKEIIEAPVLLDNDHHVLDRARLLLRRGPEVYARSRSLHRGSCGKGRDGAPRASCEHDHQAERANSPFEHRPNIPRSAPKSSAVFPERSTPRKHEPGISIQEGPDQTESPIAVAFFWSPLRYAPPATIAALFAPTDDGRPLDHCTLAP